MRSSFFTAVGTIAVEKYRHLLELVYWVLFTTMRNIEYLVCKIISTKLDLDEKNKKQKQTNKQKLRFHFLTRMDK